MMCKHILQGSVNQINNKDNCLSSIDVSPDFITCRCIMKSMFCEIEVRGFFSTRNNN